LTVRSNGQVEGFVNKLKRIKRQGYGRAGFPLLRQRVVHALERLYDAAHVKEEKRQAYSGVEPGARELEARFT
jgi:hypothetical protein